MRAGLKSSNLILAVYQVTSVGLRRTTTGYVRVDVSVVLHHLVPDAAQHRVQMQLVLLAWWRHDRQVNKLHDPSRCHAVVFSEQLGGPRTNTKRIDMADRLY